MDAPAHDAHGPAIPEVISRYQRAHDQHDHVTALCAFAPDARVVDDGREFCGADAIGDWLVDTSNQFTFERTLISTNQIDSDTWLVVNHLAGDFPGGVVDLRYRFVLSGGVISELVIAP